VAEVYIVVDWFGVMDAAFTFPELAEEYAKEKSVAKFRQNLGSINQLDQGPPYGACYDKLKKNDIPIYTLFSEYSDEEIYKILCLFRPDLGCSYREVKLLA